MLSLIEVLARSSVEELEGLAGATSVSLLRQLKPSHITEIGLAQLILRQFGEAAVLVDTRVRDVVIGNLEPEEAAKICDLMGVPAADPIDTLRGAVRNATKLETLVGHFALPSASSFPNRPRPPSVRSSPADLLEPHQTDGFRRLRRALGPANSKLLLQMPYGSGKLRLLATAVADLYRAEADGRVVLWFCLGEQLCESAFLELKEIWQTLGTRSTTVNRVFGTHPIPDLSNMSDGFYVVDIEKFASGIDAKDPGLVELTRRTSVLVLHDVRWMLGTPFAVILDSLEAAGELRIVALSASTAAPSGGRSFDEVIGFSGDKPIAYLLDAGAARPIEVEILDRPRSSADLTPVGQFDLGEDIHAKLAADMPRNAELLNAIVAQAEAGEHVIFYASTSEQAKMFTGLLAVYGVLALTVTGGMSPEERLQIFARFQQQGDIPILCVHDVLVSGRDVPKATVALISAPTTSATRFSAMFGRLVGGRGGGVSGALRLIVVDDGIPGFKEMVLETTSWIGEQQ